jgi:hypothetical protein
LSPGNENISKKGHMAKNVELSSSQVKKHTTVMEIILGLEAWLNL